MHRIIPSVVDCVYLKHYNALLYPGKLCSIGSAWDKRKEINGRGRVLVVEIIAWYYQKIDGCVMHNSNMQLLDHYVVNKS